MKARALAFIAPSCLCLFCLSSCGGGEESPTQSTTTTAQRTGGERSIEGYGEEAKGAQRQQILTAFTAYLNAIGDKDYASACGLLAKEVKDSLAKLAKGKASCEELLAAILAPTAAPLSRAQASGEVTRVRVEGEHAFVVFKAPGAKLWQLTMLSEGGRWRAASGGAAVLVPDL